MSPSSDESVLVGTKIAVIIYKKVPVVFPNFHLMVCDS